MMQVGESFVSPRRELPDPVTGRRIVQLTSGDCFDYPLYYYIPTMTEDDRVIVFYRCEEGEVQHYKIDVATGTTTKLTRAATPNCLWRPWQHEAPATGVRDHMSAFNTVAEELVYFDRNDVHVLDVHSLADRIVYHLPDDRTPCALTGVRTDGKWFCFAHVDAELWSRHVAKGPERTDLKDVRLDALRIESGTTRTLVEANHWITHCNFNDHERVLFSHGGNERAILLTDIGGGYYTHLRTMQDGLQTCHYQATKRGILYEVITEDLTGRIGMCDPDSHRGVEYRTSRRVYHVGYDREGKLWFDTADNTIRYFPTLTTGELNDPLPLTSVLKTYSVGQRSHLHPAVTNRREFILYTGGDPRNETNHLFLLDLADLQDAETTLC